LDKEHRLIDAAHAPAREDAFSMPSKLRKPTIDWRLVIVLMLLLLMALIDGFALWFWLRCCAMP
jgi:hypothetical protein